MTVEDAFVVKGYQVEEAKKITVDGGHAALDKERSISWVSHPGTPSLQDLFNFANTYQALLS
jgi:Tfp pilus assembly major pilin PilA